MGDLSIRDLGVQADNFNNPVNYAKNSGLLSKVVQNRTKSSQKPVLSDEELSICKKAIANLAEAAENLPQAKTKLEHFQAWMTKKWYGSPELNTLVGKINALVPHGTPKLPSQEVITLLHFLQEPEFAKNRPVPDKIKKAYGALGKDSFLKLLGQEVAQDKNFFDQIQATANEFLPDETSEFSQVLRGFIDQTKAQSTVDIYAGAFIRELEANKDNLLQPDNPKVKQLKTLLKSLMKNYEAYSLTVKKEERLPFKTYVNEEIESRIALVLVRKEDAKRAEIRKIQETVSYWIDVLRGGQPLHLPPIPQRKTRIPAALQRKPLPPLPQTIVPDEKQRVRDADTLKNYKNEFVAQLKQASTSENQISDPGERIHNLLSSLRQAYKKTRREDVFREYVMSAIETRPEQDPMTIIFTVSTWIDELEAKDAPP